MERLLFAVLAAVALTGFGDERGKILDSRNVRNGSRIPAQNYVDQPYVAVLTNGAWLCVLTTGKGLEGQPGQHVVSTVSKDQGKTWSEPKDIEPETGPEASWATPLATPSGRVYAFYVYNGDEVYTLPGSDKRVRSDTHGWYVFRFTDDGGETWSAQRYRIPIRTTSIDRRNPWRGEVCHFWGIDKPKVQDGKVYFAITKLGTFFMQDGEGWVIESDNILTERDPDKIAFKLLPDGDKGIKNPALGSVQEEFNVVPLGSNSLFCVCRLGGGTPAQSYSHDGGATWSLPVPMTYGPGGRVMKTPRACPKLFRTSDGRFLFWFHDHGGRQWSGRNPAFLSGGVLGADGLIHWSEPELVLFDENPAIRMSYPDLIEQDGKFWLTETQKTVARVHALDPELVAGLWAPPPAVSTNGLAADKLDAGGAVSRIDLPKAFGAGSGVTVELRYSLADSVAGQLLFNSMNDEGRGVRIVTSELGGKPALTIELGDGFRVAAWQTDPGAVKVGVPQQVDFICDFSADVVMVVADGQLCDGGEARPQGWGRLPSDLSEVQGAPQAAIGPQVKAVRLYSRALRVSEVLGNWKAK